jgi:hypothetical protein
MLLMTVTFNCVIQMYIQIYPCVRFMLCNLRSAVISRWFPWSPLILGMVSRASLGFIVIDRSKLVVY